MQTATKIGVRASRHEVGIFCGPFELGFRVHRNDWALAVTLWSPGALIVTVGVFSLIVGNTSRDRHVGPGVGVIRNGSVLSVYAHLSDSLWVESGAASW